MAEEKKSQETGVEEIPDKPKEQSLLEIKLENMQLKASISLYNSIKKHLTDKKSKDKARNKAEEIYAEIQPHNFDEIAKSKGAKTKTSPLETIPDGGEPVKACYHLAPNKEKSEIFFNSGSGRVKTTPFYGIGILIEKEKAKDSEISQKEDSN